LQSSYSSLGEYRIAPNVRGLFITYNSSNTYHFNNLLLLGLYMLKRKSRVVSFVCTFFLGAIGLFYSSISLGFLMVIAVLSGTIMFGPYAPLILWPIGVILGDYAVKSHNTAYEEWLSAFTKNH
jgi:hypothetical protein